MSPSLPYHYPTKNSDLIQCLNLEKHFEGGYFVQNVALPSHQPASPTWPSTLPKSPEVQAQGREQAPFGPGAVLTGGPVDTPSLGEALRLDATLIYYLLTGDSHRGKMHMNLHSHFHLLHSGRALYTLIKPPASPGELPIVKKVMLGGDVLHGETPQLFVPGGWWKASEIPPEDLAIGADKEEVGCLISEVVVPGWTPQQHMFIDEQKLKDMWGGKEGWEEYAKYLESA